MTSRTYAADSTRLLDRLLAELELPDCRCSFARTPCPCGADDCRHPPVYPPPCKHVRGHTHTIPVEQWAALLYQSDPAEYAEPDVAVLTTPAFPGSAERIEVMRKRHARRQALRHPLDADPTRPAFDTSGIGVARHKRNGSIQRTGLKRKGKGKADAA